MDFLPYYYKEADTYKVAGKGILERYLEIFGNYFEDYIVEDTKNILDILDIDHCPEIYLNYLWEFLGQMPFAYGCNIDAEKWAMYFNGFDSDERIAELSQLWIIPKDDSDNFNLSTDQVRKFLKYSVSLFKIRGTKRFFEILFKMYDLNCEIGMPPSERFDANANNYYGTDDDFAGSDSETADYEGREMYISRYVNTKADIEDNNMDECPLDKRSVCTRCITLPVSITNHSFGPIDTMVVPVTIYEIESDEWSKIMLDQNDYILWGLYRNGTEYTPDLTGHTITINGTACDAQDIVDRVKNGNQPNPNFLQFQKICEAIFDRFLPYNVQANINYGFDILCTYHISTYLKEGDEWLFLKSDTDSDATNLAKLYLQDNIRRELQVKVVVTRTYRNQDDLKFRVGSITQGVDPTVLTMGEGEHVSSDVIRITRSLEDADYLFKSSEPNSDGTYTQVSLPVTRKLVERDFHIGYNVTSDNDLEIDPEHPSVSIQLQGWVDENHDSSQRTYLRIRDIETGQIYNHGSEVSLSTPGVRNYCLVDFPIKRISVNITRVTESLAIYSNPTTFTIDEVGKTAKTLVHVEGDYWAEPGRSCLCVQILTKDSSLDPEQEVSIAEVMNTYIVDGETNNPGEYYAHGAIPLITYPDNFIHPVNKIRICCLKEVIRQTAQYLRIRFRDVTTEGGELKEVNTYTDLWDKLIFHNGRLVYDGGSYSIQASKYYVYSDWLDVTEYQRGIAQDPSAQYRPYISRLEFHLINSNLRYYEVSNRSVEYNSGEIFETAFPGSFKFRPVLIEGTQLNYSHSEATLQVNSTINSDVRYGINVNPLSLTYQIITPSPSGPNYSKAVNTVVSIVTNLDYQEGVNRDTPLNPLPGFKFYVYEKGDYFDHTPGHIPTAKATVNPNDNWVVNSQNSKYEKRISFQFTDGNYGDEPLPDFPAQDVEHLGQYVIVLDPTFEVKPGSSDYAIVTLHNYVDISEDHVVMIPVYENDPAWLGKDWSINNTSATWNPSLTNHTNYEYFKISIQGTSGSLSGYTTAVVYKLQGDTYVDTGTTFSINTAIPPSTSPLDVGKYRIRLKDSGDNLSASYVDFEVAAPVTFNIKCDPTEIPQDMFPGSFSIIVSAWVIGGTVPEEQLMVKKEGENTWYPSGHSFLIPNPNTGTDVTYTFKVKGDSSKSCTFTYLGHS